MSFPDLRAFLGYLEERGELVTIDEPVDQRYEIAAYIRKSSDLQGPAFRFTNVRGHRMPVVGGVFCSPRKALLALETEDHHAALERFVEAIQHPVEPRLVASGPCQEVRLYGEDIDLTRLPIPTYSVQDGGAFVTVGVGLTLDPETGVRNAGMYRMQLQGPRHLGLELCPYTDCHTTLTRCEARGEPMPMSIAIGIDPVIQLATQARVGYGQYELSIAGALRGAPVEVVECQTNAIAVPATAEIVLEGRVLPGVRREEGPFGEFTGYVGPATQSPVFECTAITMRADAFYQAGLTGAPVTENHVLKILPAEANLLTTLRQAYPDITAVSMPPEAGADFLAVIALEQRYENQARSLILSALGSAAHPKLVVVTDSDVDIYDMAKVWWAIATRCQPAQDLIVVPRAAGGQLDPSAPSAFSSSIMGIDATRPFGQPFPEVVEIPGLERVPDWTRQLLRS